MKTITINISEELLDKLELLAFYENKTPAELLTEKVDLYFEFNQLLDRMVSK